MSLALLLLLFSGMTMASTTIYRWVDKNGVVHYTDKPPPNGNAKPAKLPPLQTFEPSQATPAVATQSPKSRVVERPAPPPPRIVEPKNHATLRNAQHVIDVRVNVALAPNQGLVYYVDGKAQNNNPTRATQFVLRNVYRGTHSVAVALIGTQGKPIGVSKPVVVYMKPPRIHHQAHTGP